MVGMTAIGNAKVNTQVADFRGQGEGLRMLQLSSREGEDVDSQLDDFSDQVDVAISRAMAEDEVPAVAMHQVPTPVVCVDPGSTTFPAAQDWLRQHVI